MSKGIIEILSELKNKLVNELKEEIHEIILFGSHIYNLNNDESDLDVLIVLNNTYDWKKKRMIRDICYEIGVKYHIMIDSKRISTYELNNTPKGIHPIYKDAIENGIHA